MHGTKIIKDRIINTSDNIFFSGNTNPISFKDSLYTICLLYTSLILKHRDLWREVIESLAEIAVRKKDPKLTEFIISLLTHIKIQMLCHGSLKLSTSVIHSSMPREISLLTYTCLLYTSRCV